MINKKNSQNRGIQKRRKIKKKQEMEREKLKSKCVIMKMMVNKTKSYLRLPLLKPFDDPFAAPDPLVHLLGVEQWQGNVLYGDAARESTGVSARWDR